MVDAIYIKLAERAKIQAATKKLNSDLPHSDHWLQPLTATQNNLLWMYTLIQSHLPDIYSICLQTSQWFENTQMPWVLCMVPCVNP